MSTPKRSHRVQRAAERYRTRGPGIDTRHSFAFGEHYDAANTHHGLLVALNDDRLAPGAGYDDHPHADLEIVTWVVEGAVTYRDSAGRTGTARPGTVQHLTAGSGVVHSERNESTEPARLVQMWLVPDRLGREPAYQLREVAAELAAGGLVSVAEVSGGRATMHAGRLAAGTSVALPDAAYRHLFVVDGEVDIGGLDVATERLGSGDALRTTGRFDVALRVHTDSDVLVWAMTADPTGGP